jgi:hypothetical protein
VVRTILKNLPTVQLQTLGGYAGTGKTTVLLALADALPDFAVVAFTGRAASVLRQRGVDWAATIHSTIYRPTVLDDGSVRFRLKPRGDVNCRGFLVDEASMVGSQLQRDLASFGLPIVYFGDHGQLPPVCDGEVDLTPISAEPNSVTFPGRAAYFSLGFWRFSCPDCHSFSGAWRGPVGSHAGGLGHGVLPITVV